MPQSYSITDLGTLPGGTSSIATALNSKGEVVGTSTQTSANGVSTDQAFVWKNGQITALGVLPGSRTSQATGISDGEQICGTSVTSSGGAFLSINGVLTNIAPLPGDAYSAAVGINAGGQIALSSSPAGASQPPNTYAVLPSHAAVSNQGILTEIKVPAGETAISPTAINAAGQVVGTSLNQNKVSRAFLYQNGTLSFLGVLPGDDSSGASAVNANSQAVGFSALKIGTDASGQNPVSAFHAALFTGGKVIGLGMLPGDTQSVATGINDSGQIIGISYGQAGGDGNGQHPFLYTSGTLVDLRSRVLASSNWTLSSVTGINNAGQVCGMGQHNGHLRAFLLSPQ